MALPVPGGGGCPRTTDTVALCRSGSPHLHRGTSRGVLNRKKKFRNGSFAKRLRVAHMFNHGWWRLAVGGGWWRLAAVGGGWWLVTDGWWRLAVGRCWRLAIGGGWWLVVPRGGP